MSVIKLICAFMQTSNKHLIFFVFTCIERLWGGCIFPSIYQSAITGVKRMKTKNQRKICAFLLLLFLILVGLFLVFSLKWLIGESGDYLICIIKFVPEMLFALGQMDIQGIISHAYLIPSALLPSWKSVALSLELLLSGKIIDS